MSRVGVTDALVAAIASGAYDFIVANYANPDMVGHTGVWDATVRRSRSSMPASRRRRRDRGRREPRPDGPAPAGDHRRPRQRRRLRDEAGRPVTAHSLNPVPIVLLVGPSRGPPLATASWPMSPRRCSSSPACRLGRDDRHSLVADGLTALW
jgi:2,3-bisphosphoglycerate-independent phosphoglycerate mutase